MHTAHKDPSQTQYRPSRGGRGADPMDTVSLNGDCVRDAEGEEIGRIEGVMLDGSRDRIMYAILSLGGSLGGDGRLFAVPWSVLQGEQRRGLRGSRGLQGAAAGSAWLRPRQLAIDHRPRLARRGRCLLRGPAPAQVTSFPRV